MGINARFLLNRNRVWDSISLVTVIVGPVRMEGDLFFFWVHGNKRQGWVVSASLVWYERTIENCQHENATSAHKVA